nr:MAG TPA: hypothetical protein [Caudoviricetes sp.]
MQHLIKVNQITFLFHFLALLKVKYYLCKCKKKQN